jgi:hypothetical protein
MNEFEKIQQALDHLRGTLELIASTAAKAEAHEHEQGHAYAEYTLASIRKLAEAELQAEAINIT